jgi:hypothetical protein
VQRSLVYHVLNADVTVLGNQIGFSPC